MQAIPTRQHSSTSDSSTQESPEERALYITRLLCKQQCRLVGSLAGKTLAQLDATPALGEALRVAREVIGSYPDGQHGFILQGDPGCGKTHMLAATVSELINKGCHAEFWTSAEFLGAIRASYSNHDVLDPTARLSKLPVLALDELGGENISSKNSEWAQEQLLNLINARCSRCGEGRITLMTTNLKAGELQQRIGARSLSRIYEMAQWVAVKAPDYRIKIQTQMHTQHGEVK